MKKIIILLSILCLIQAVYAQCSEFDSFAQYNIQENSGIDLVDYQIKLYVDSDSLISSSDMLSNCSDIRVQNGSGDYLPYWFNDTNCGSTNMTVWTKIPVIPASGTKEINLCYGNQSYIQTNKSGDDTFLLYDDFTNGYDNLKWKNTTAPGGTFTVQVNSNNELYLSATGPLNSVFESNDSHMYGMNTSLVFYASWNIQGGNGELIGIGNRDFFTSVDSYHPSNWSTVSHLAGHPLYENYSVPNTYFPNFFDTHHRFEITRHGNETVDFIIDDSFKRVHNISIPTVLKEFNVNLYSNSEGNISLVHWAQQVTPEPSYSTTSTTSTTTTTLITFGISGYVKTENGTPINAAQLDIYSTYAETHQTDYANASGYYEFSFGIVDEWNITANKSGYGKECLELGFVEGEVEYNITMYPYDIEFYVFDNESFLTPIENAIVFIQSIDSFDTAICTTNDTGLCHLNFTSGHYYDVHVTAPGYTPIDLTSYFYAECNQVLPLGLDILPYNVTVELFAYDTNNFSVVPNTLFKVFSGITQLTSNTSNADGYSYISLPHDVYYKFIAQKSGYGIGEYYETIRYNGQEVAIPINPSGDTIYKYTISGLVTRNGEPASNERVYYDCNSLTCETCDTIGFVTSNSTGYYTVNNVFDNSVCSIFHYITGSSVYDFRQNITVSGSNKILNISLGIGKIYQIWWIKENPIVELSGVTVRTKFNSTMYEVSSNTYPYSVYILNNTNVSLNATKGGYVNRIHTFISDSVNDAESMYLVMNASTPAENYSYIIFLLNAISLYNSTDTYEHTFQFNIEDTTNINDSFVITIGATNPVIESGAAGFVADDIKKDVPYILTMSSNTYILTEGSISFTAHDDYEDEIILHIQPKNPVVGGEMSNQILTEFWDNWAYNFFLMGALVIFFILLNNMFG